jgi:hypothetical protein
LKFKSEYDTLNAAREWVARKCGGRVNHGRGM